MFVGNSTCICGDIWIDWGLKSKPTNPNNKGKKVPNMKKRFKSLENYYRSHPVYLEGNPAHTTLSRGNSLNWRQDVLWTDILGNKEIVSVEAHTVRDAIEKAFAKASNRGWKPKKWWQVWRWYDTPDLRRILI